MNRPLLAIVPAAALLLAACDDKPKNEDRKSVMEGGKAESQAGKQLEGAKREIEATEKQLQDRADEQFEKSAGENAPARGMP